MKRKRKVIIPTPEEDAIINAGIADDPDTFELDEEWFANALTTEELLAQYPELAKVIPPSNSRNTAPKGEPVSVRIDADIADHFRNSGVGWERRLNQTLRQTVFGNGKAAG